MIKKNNDNASIQDFTKLNITYLSNLMEEKGIFDLLEAFAHDKNQPHLKS